MKALRPVSVVVVVGLVLGLTALGSSVTRAAKAPPLPADSTLTLAQACERQLKSIEKTIVDAAEAMPEDRFDFTPESSNIPGSAYAGVRTFAGQVKHLATDNFAIWSPMTGEPMPPGIKDVNGPEELKSKAEIVAFLKDSFALGHRAIATLTAQDAVEMLPFRGTELPRIDLAFFALTHANEHYGQMVVYLRMCGIIPPASRPR